MSSHQPDISAFVYSPYSNRSEYCHIIGKSGLCYPGVRIENISFPLTISAVQAAICNCMANDDVPIAIVQKTEGPELTDSWIKKLELEELEAVSHDCSIYNPLIKKVSDIKQTLKELCDLSVSDQSNFPVTALLKTESGFVPGVNIEFEEWNFGLCAERVALSRAVAAGYSNFEEIHIYAPKSEYISPCGACRQVLFELMPDQTVKLYHDEQSASTHFVSHLLPNGFISSSLKD